MDNSYYSQYQEDINAIWITKLYHEFDIANLLLKRSLGKTLEYPEIEISDTNATWGK